MLQQPVESVSYDRLVLILRASSVASLAALLAMIVGLAAQPPALPSGSALLVLTREGRRTLAISVAGGHDMVSLTDLADMFALSVGTDPVTRDLTIGYKGNTIALATGQPLASVRGRLISLPVAPVSTPRGWLVPVEFLSRALAPIYDAKIDLRQGSRLLIIGDLNVPRVTVRHEMLGSHARVTFDISPPTDHTVTQEAGSLIVRFQADALDATLPVVEPRELVQSIRLQDSPAAIVLQTGPRFATYRSSDQPGDRAVRLVLDLLTQGAEGAQPSPTTPGPGTAPELAPLPEPTPASSIRTVVVDPGHGGDDLGARTAERAAEKDVTSSVARRLKALLEARMGVRVLLTRDGDRSIGLDQRAAIANNNKADVFLSLHANASVRPIVSGADVYYLSLEEYGEEARRLATAEPQTLPVFGGGIRPLEMVRWEMAQVAHIGQSAVLAQLVFERLQQRIEMSRHSAQQGPFRVLVGANMPAVLVEMGFMSNPQQARKLVSGVFQDAVAQALYESIVRFRDYLDQQRMPPAVGESRQVSQGLSSNED